VAAIALVHYAAPPVVGGVERVLGRQAALLADDGYGVRIVTGRGELFRPDIELRHIPLADSRHPEILALRAELAAGRRPPELATLSDALYEALEAALAGCDLVIVHNVASLDMNLALTDALHRRAGEGERRWVLWHHDLAWARPADRHRLHPGHPWSLLRTPWPGALQVAVSEARRDELAALLGVEPATITVVPNGIDLPEALPAWLLAAVGEMIDRDGPLLVLPARIAPRKNIEVALRIVAAMRERGRDAGLLVTGPVDPHDAGSPEAGYLEGLMALRGSLGLGAAAWFAAAAGEAPLTDAEVDALYGVSDALILPSRDEGFGLPILEAAVRRLPIVCSDLPVLRQLAGDAAVYIDPDGDPAVLATRILEVLDADGVGRLARHVRRERSWPAVYRHHLAPLVERALAEA
jgi:glycosyltransferase involved in cell wall biosynthesis